MVLQFNLQHLFKFPVESVMKSYLKLHKHQNEVKKMEELEPTTEDDMVCTKRNFTVANYFSSFFQKVKLLNREVIDLCEDIWAQDKERRYWIRSRNVTWEDELTLGKVTYASPDNSNDNWTIWEESTAVDFSYFGKFGTALEFYLKRKLEKNAMRNLRIMENLLRTNDLD